MRINADDVTHRVLLRALAIGFVASCPFVNVSPANAAVQATSIQLLVNSHVLLQGPVDGVDSAQSKIRVLGQWVVVPCSQGSIPVGDMVTIKGVVTANGTYSVSSVTPMTSGSYVPGATKLFLQGLVTSINSATGNLRIGEYTVNYTGALHTLAGDKLAVGELVSFTGLAFTGISSLYADNGEALPKPSSQIVVNNQVCSNS